MIDGLTPYTDRKDSGFPWLGEIPAHWDVRRNGRLFVQRNQTGFPDLPILEVSLKTGVRVRDFENSNRKQVMADREKYKRARQGDIAYNMMRMWQGAVGTSPADGLVSPAYVVAKPLPDTESRYYQYLFRTGAYMDEVNKFSRGIVSDRNRLYWEDFKQMPSPFPPPEEQAAIVRFLDHADRRIRRYIRAKRQLIALLNEQKQAIIHRAVTRGLDPHVKLKPSGVEWLGDVPEHWEIRPVRHFARVQGGKALAANAPGTQMPYLRVANVFDGWIDASQINTMPFSDDEFDRYRLHDGDLLLNEGQSLALVGRTARYLGEPKVCAFQNSLIRVQARAEAEGEYLEFVFRQAQRNRIFAIVATQTTNIAHLGVSRLANLVFAIPTIAEQRHIVQHINTVVPEIDAAIKQASHAMDLLDEYRRRLIADVVTGKLDVREAAAALPNELEAVESDAEELLDEDDTTDNVELDTEPEEVEA